MYITPRIQSALQRAAQLHRDHLRKDVAKTPYLYHLVAVAWIAAEYTDDEEVVMAALLHDSVEDIAEYTFEMLEEEFGQAVRKLVAGVTLDSTLTVEGDRAATWKLQAEDYRANLRAASAGSTLVSCADKLHNIGDMMEGFADNGGQEYLARFGGQLSDRFAHYDAIMDIAREKGVDEKLIARLAERSKEARELFGL